MEVHSAGVTPTPAWALFPLSQPIAPSAIASNQPFRRRRGSFSTQAYWVLNPGVGSGSIFKKWWQSPGEFSIYHFRLSLEFVIRDNKMMWSARKYYSNYDHFSPGLDGYWICGLKFGIRRDLPCSLHAILTPIALSSASARPAMHPLQKFLTLLYRTNPLVCILKWLGVTGLQQKGQKLYADVRGVQTVLLLFVLKGYFMP